MSPRTHICNKHSGGFCRRGYELALRNADSVPPSLSGGKAQKGAVTTKRSQSKFVAGLGNWDPKTPELCRTPKQTPGSPGKELSCSGEFPLLLIEFRIGEGIVTLQLEWADYVCDQWVILEQAAAMFCVPAAGAAC